MDNYGIQINLLSLKEAKVETTRDGRRIVTIDVTDTPSYIHDVPANRAVYLNMVAFGLDRPGKYGESHIVKPKLLPGEFMPDGSHPPIMGNMKQYAPTSMDARRKWRQAQESLREREAQQIQSNYQPINNQ